MTKHQRKDIHQKNKNSQEQNDKIPNNINCQKGTKGIFNRHTCKIGSTNRQKLFNSQPRWLKHVQKGNKEQNRYKHFS